MSQMLTTLFIWLAEEERREGLYVTQYNMANLQKTSQDSGGLSIFVAEGKEMLGRVGSTNQTG